MSRGTGEPLDLSNRRYWRQNAEMAVRDIYDALIEIITNADDRYVLLGVPKGRIEIEVERRRKETPSIIRVRDFADGMTVDDMKMKLQKVAGRVSGLQEGKSVRGTFSRGAKDVAILGGVAFDSIANDGRFHHCEITAQGMFHVTEPSPKASVSHRKELKIMEGTGTVVTILVDSEVIQVPQHDTLRQKLGHLVSLRDIFSSPSREIAIYDLTQARSDLIKAPDLAGYERVNERFRVPGYDNVEAKITIKRATSSLHDAGLRFRTSGILVKSRHAIHEATLFASDLENDPYAKRFFGKLTCEYIDDLSDDWDDRFEKGLPPTPSNPRPILDPVRKEGLSREHPFVEKLYKEALKRLRPLVEEERRREESQQAKIENEDTRKRLNALEKAAAKFMSENREQNEPSRDPNEGAADTIFKKKGYSLNPPFAQLVAGQSTKFWLSISQQAFPELSAGDSVEITCATQEISSSSRFIALEPHPSLEEAIRCVWTVKGEVPTAATAIKVRVGSITTESTIEVLESERDRYKHVQRLCFDHKTYSVRTDARKTVTLLAPYPSVVAEATPIEITCSERSFKLSGDRVLTPRPELGVAICKIKVAAEKADQKGILVAHLGNQACEANVLSVDPGGAAIKIELKDVDHKSQRYRWRGNVLEIAARHPSLKRYLGEAPEFAGQNDKHYRVLLAETVAEAVCADVLSRNSTDPDQESEYGDYDWDAYYATYTELMTKFLPIAHETQVKL